MFNGFSGTICSGESGQYDCKCYKCCYSLILNWGGGWSHSCRDSSGAAREETGEQEIADFNICLSDKAELSIIHLIKSKIMRKCSSRSSS